MTGVLAATCGPAGPQIQPNKRLKFLSLYPFVAQHIYKAPGDPKWKFSRVRLFTGMIDGAISLEADTLYGAYFGPKTQHAVLDIDEDSRYHNDAELQRLQQVLSDVALSFVRYQSSNGGGWHLYLFFDDWQDSNEVAHGLKQLLQANAFVIEQGHLEIFPSKQGLRLPLQRGFAWLDRNVAREPVPGSEVL